MYLAHILFLLFLSIISVLLSTSTGELNGFLSFLFLPQVEWWSSFFLSLKRTCACGAVDIPARFIWTG